MKEDIIEYHPNGNIKHKISFNIFGDKALDVFFDEDNNVHKDNGVAKQTWHQNGSIACRIYGIHGYYHNLSNPAECVYFTNKKINRKTYALFTEETFNMWNTAKLDWLNIIKNI